MAQACQTSLLVKEVETGFPLSRPVGDWLRHVLEQTVVQVPPPMKLHSLVEHPIPGNHFRPKVTKNILRSLPTSRDDGEEGDDSSQDVSPHARPQVCRCHWPRLGIFF